jgi:hypothetical protein
MTSLLNLYLWSFWMPFEMGLWAVELGEEKAERRP